MRAYRRTRYILISKRRRENNIERRRLGVKGIRNELNVGYLFKWATGYPKAPNSPPPTIHHLPKLHNGSAVANLKSLQALSQQPTLLNIEESQDAQDGSQANYDATDISTQPVEDENVESGPENSIIVANLRVETFKGLRSVESYTLIIGAAHYSIRYNNGRPLHYLNTNKIY
ncbi:hypothetical protein JOM56_002794 [Amanita muscaria]